MLRPRGAFFHLDLHALPGKVQSMDSNLASEHLQVIRTLMERSAVYRRALAPIMIGAGVIGLLGAVVPCFHPIHSNRSFAIFWMCVGVAAVVLAYLLARRQALREQEAFWTPPAKRVTEALLPPFYAGASIGLASIIFGDNFDSVAWLAAAMWIVLYGCGLNAAGFFTPRGLRLFGSAFVCSGTVFFMLALAWPQLRTPQAAHGVMGLFFGGLHLAYGGYLYFTEPKRP